jgi:diaminohydroxyphosphoribosylaminopyrimidine deaminase / 5-amino-6-(5-phosphoribosylamino)uracil reductase
VNDHDVRFMDHALALAAEGVGLASPNPTVGCIVVRGREIVGEGFHRYDQRDHAEIVALRTAGERARGATLYVTLEPCNHTGRTGPCTEAIIAAGIERVVAAMEDPNPKTNGAGFARLRQSGIQVESGIRPDPAERLNQGFSHWIRTGIPFVSLKAALTLDGQLTLQAAKRRDWITSEQARAEVQRMRHASDALLTGIGTILADNPLLTDRSGLPRRRRLLRVVLDTRLRLSPSSRLVQTAEDDLVVFTSADLKSPKARRLEEGGVKLVRLKPQARPSFLGAVLRELGRRGILSVLMEAGPALNGVALSSGLVNNLVLFVAPRFAMHTKFPLVLPGRRKLPSLRITGVAQFGPDVRIEARPIRAR